MAWSTPKVDWYCEVDSDGVYSGDRFNAVDFNRIKNNIEYLAELANTMYEPFSIVPLGVDRTPYSYFYADEINTFSDNLSLINSLTLNLSYPGVPVYADNSTTPSYVEWNRIEGAILELYNALTNQSNGRRMFTWNFGMKGGGL